MVQRAIAFKLNLKQILEANYVQGGNIENPNHILVNNEKVTRVNIIGKITDKYENLEAKFSSLTINSDEKLIKVKFFNGTNVSDFTAGDLVKVIGKVRESQEERFILGEIVKPVTEEYETLRKLEVEEPLVNKSDIE